MTEKAATPAENDPAYLKSSQDELDAGTCDGYFTFEEIDLMFGEGKWRAISQSFPG